jgi:regulator of cell morphogenesis and NO signaling
MAPLSELIHFIVSHYHERLRTELPQLVTLAKRLETGHSGEPTCPHGLGAHLEAVHSAMLEHLAKEERVLFPMILEGYGARTGGPVRVMELEHDEHTRNMARIRELTNNLAAPPAACETWRDLYRRLAQLEAELFDHIQLENTVLFPRALSED